jgi:hypothetical protein
MVVSVLGVLLGGCGDKAADDSTAPATDTTKTP